MSRRFHTAVRRGILVIGLAFLCPFAAAEPEATPVPVSPEAMTPEDVCRAYDKAIAAGDADTFLGCISRTKGLNGQCPSTRQGAVKLLETVKASRPAQVKIVRTSIVGTKATVTLESVGGEEQDGTVYLVSEQGVWQMVGEQWAPRRKPQPVPAAGSGQAGATESARSTLERLEKVYEKQLDRIFFGGVSARAFETMSLDQAKETLVAASNYRKELRAMQESLKKGRDQTALANVTDALDALGQSPEIVAAKRVIAARREKEREAEQAAAAGEPEAAKPVVHEPVSRLTIKLFIAGSDLVKVQGSRLWIEHQAGVLPGRFDGSHFPAHINGKEWDPVWPGGGSCQPFSGVTPALGSIGGGTVRIMGVDGAGEVTVVEQPGPDNGQTLSLLFTSTGAGGKWVEAAVGW